MTRYTHKETGATDTREGWLSSYDPQELAARGLNAEQAFKEDEGHTLIEILTPPVYCTQNEGNCLTCSLVSYGRDCMNNRVKS